MNEIIKIILSSYLGFYNYLVAEITLSYTYKPLWQNFFYLLIAISLFFFALEIALPWRKNQAKIRKDFWLDAFYMFFNFFIFSLIFFTAASNVVVYFFNDLLGAIGIKNLLAIEVSKMPIWVHLLLGFVVRDFVQWWIHRLLHKVPKLWQFHKVHHSVQEMGFAAHLRYHWMENIVYKTIEYIPLALIGISLNDFFIIHIFTLIIGHHNHANVSLPQWTKGLGFGFLIGIFAAFTAFETTTWIAALPIIGISMLVGLIISPIIKYIFNSPEMHIWHHVYTLPEGKTQGINFGITLSCWDYIFGTNHIPSTGKDIKLGFPADKSQVSSDQFPSDFIGQASYGFFNKKSTTSQKKSTSLND